MIRRNIKTNNADLADTKLFKELLSNLPDIFHNAGIELVGKQGDCRFYKITHDVEEYLWEAFNTYMEEHNYFFIDGSSNGIQHYTKF